MKKILTIFILLFTMFALYSCDKVDEYKIEEWRIHECVDDGVILDDGALIGKKFLETDDITCATCEVGDKVFIRIYDSGKLEIVKPSLTTEEE